MTQMEAPARTSRPAKRQIPGRRLNLSPHQRLRAPNWLFSAGTFSQDDLPHLHDQDRSPRGHSLPLITFQAIGSRHHRRSRLRRELPHLIPICHRCLRSIYLACPHLDQGLARDLVARHLPAPPLPCHHYSQTVDIRTRARLHPPRRHPRLTSRVRLLQATDYLESSYREYSYSKPVDRSWTSCAHCRTSRLDLSSFQNLLAYRPFEPN